MDGIKLPYGGFLGVPLVIHFRDWTFPAIFGDPYMETMEKYWKPPYINYYQLPKIMALAWPLANPPQCHPRGSAPTCTARMAGPTDPSPAGPPRGSRRSHRSRASQRDLGLAIHGLEVEMRTSLRLGWVKSTSDHIKSNCSKSEQQKFYVNMGRIASRWSWVLVLHGSQRTNHLWNFQEIHLWDSSDRWGSPDPKSMNILDLSIHNRGPF